MYRPHVHHILPQVGIGPEQQGLVKIGQKILISVGIDPINGIENLVYAANGHGVHTKGSILALVSDLKQATKYDEVVAVLKKHGDIAAVK
jgi:hypothetical protein